MDLFALGIALIMGGLTLALFLLDTKYKKIIKALQEANEKILSQKKSSEVRSGLISEQMVPFLSVFKHDPLNAHFIGKPIDYIIFNPDEIVFLEVKYGKSSLKSNQRNIRNLINAKKVRWEEIYLEEPKT